MTNVTNIETSSRAIVERSSAQICDFLFEEQDSDVMRSYELSFDERLQKVAAEIDSSELSGSFKEAMNAVYKKMKLSQCKAVSESGVRLIAAIETQADLKAFVTIMKPTTKEVESLLQSKKRFADLNIEIAFCVWATYVVNVEGLSIGTDLSAAQKIVDKMEGSVSLSTASKLIRRVVFSEVTKSKVGRKPYA